MEIYLVADTEILGSSPHKIALLKYTSTLFKVPIYIITSNFNILVKVENDYFHLKNEFYGENNNRKILVRISISDGFGPWNFGFRLKNLVLVYQ